ncbi:hypothetical protein [Haloarcula sp. CGMCC 1.2071]|uniref:hypothetical protein n=1 Tax=Haloarcula sp. CGMCC 1.2071 TaxID=3111454 RepID=UPI00300EEC7C
MSEVDGSVSMDTAVDLLDPDPSEFEDGEALREWVEERLGELELTLAETEDRVEDHDARLDAREAHGEALSRKIETVEEQAKRAERLAKWGGLGYEDRLRKVLATLLSRASQNQHVTGGPEGHETKHIAHITPTEEEQESGSRPGVYELFDGAVSARTCRSYVRTLADVRGFSVRESSRGGWGGGSSQMVLKLVLEDFHEAHGEEWDIEDLLAETEV